MVGGYDFGGDMTAAYATAGATMASNVVATGGSNGNNNSASLVHSTGESS